MISSSHFGSFVSKGFLLFATLDKPAKCAVQNFVQFNGMYGCGRCLQPGRTEKTSARGHVHVYPYQLSDPTGPACEIEDTEVHVANYCSHMTST